MASRLQALHRWARSRGFDVALAHGSHDLTLTARRLGIPSGTTFDYEFAFAQHELGCRAATRVTVPEAIPGRAAEAIRPPAAQAPALPGPEGGVLSRRLRAGRRPCSTRSASTPHARWSSFARPPTCPSITGPRNELFPRTVDALGHRDDVHAVVLPRTTEQRERLAALALPSVIVAAQAGRRAEPRRARRPRGVRRRHDEPRSGRARSPGLHAVRRDGSAASTRS